VIHEANVRPGLANRLLGRFADRICLGWEATRANFPSGKLRVTGNPIRREIARLAGAPGPGPPEAPYDILVTGGALGSPFLNEHIPELLAAVAARGCDLRVVHQTGETGEPDAVRQRYAKAGVEAEVTPYIEHMEESYRRSVFAIAAAGAGTLAELAACGLPCLLIPLREAAADHQTANARAFSEHTGGRWASGDDWEVDELAAHVAATLTDRERWLAESERMRAADGLGAAREVVDDCQTLMNGSW
jgi:UDP-N-acetylglucosamine--N-acetylmuramyl-(pentapeptide) pyrophosphoryl-undecaprenol N-acetylglucosamine transferase